MIPSWIPSRDEDLMRGSDQDQSMAPAEPPAWMLLDQEADVVNNDDCRNPTTAEADAGFGRLVQVSFVAADPPRVSHLRVHCPGLTKVSDFRGTPSVLQSAANVALIRVRFRMSPEKEYFLYRAAGPRRPPALQHLKGVGDYLSRLPTLAAVGFLPRGDGGDDDDGFVLAALVLASGPGRVQLHVFRSEKSSWTSRMLQVGRDGANHRPAIVERVMALGGGALAFVDLWKGILVLDALFEEEEPKYRFIPMPKLLAGNQPDDFRGELSSARPFRDIALFGDGRIRCVEVEGITRRMINGKPAEEVVAASSGETPDDDLWNTDVLHDHDLLALGAAAEKEEVKETYLYVGWRVIAWSRTLSCACWHKDFSFNADEISPNFVLKDDLVSAPTCAPTLGTDGETLYLISKTSRDQEHVIGVDTRKKTLKEISPLLTRRPTLYKLNYMACDLSKYLNTDATLQVAQHVASLSVSSAPREPIYFPRAQIHSTSYGNCQQQDPPTVGPPSRLQPPSPVPGAFVSQPLQHAQPCSISGDRYPPPPPPPPILGTLSQPPPPLPSALQVRKSMKIHDTLSQQPSPLPSALQPLPPPQPINYPFQPIYFPRAQIHNTSNSYLNYQQQDPPAVAPPLRQQPPSPAPSAFVSQHAQPCSISGDRHPPPPPPPPPVLGTLSQQPPPLPSNLQQTQPWVRCLHVDYHISCYYDLSGYGSYQQQHPEVGPIYLPPPPPPPRPFSSTLQPPQTDGFHGNDKQQHPPVVGPLCLLPPLPPLLSLSNVQQMQQQQPPPYPM